MLPPIITYDTDYEKTDNNFEFDFTNFLRTTRKQN